MNDKINFNHLERNLESNIQESIVKLGYYAGEKISIYYDEGLLCHLLKIDPEHLNTTLKSFETHITNKWGTLTIKTEKGRYKFTTSADGVKYIYEKNKDNSFLKEFISTIQDRTTGLQDILKVFQKRSTEVICEPSSTEEFNYVIYYADPTIDEFKYCISIDEMGKYYHRLTDYDYKNSL